MVEYREIIESDNDKTYLARYLRDRKRLPISLDVRLLLYDLRDRTNDHLNSFVANEIATLMIEHLEKGELTEDDLPLKKFIDLIEDYKQGNITMRVSLIRFLIMLEHYGDAIKNQAIFQKIEEAGRRRDLEALIEVQKEEMARKSKAVEYLALERRRTQLEQIPKTRRGSNSDSPTLIEKTKNLRALGLSWKEIAVNELQERSLELDRYAVDAEAQRIKQLVYNFDKKRKAKTVT